MPKLPEPTTGRQRLTAQRALVLREFLRLYDVLGYCPSMAELAKACKRSAGSVRLHMVKLWEQGRVIETGPDGAWRRYAPAPPGTPLPDPKPPKPKRKRTPKPKPPLQAPRKQWFGGPRRGKR